MNRTPPPTRTPAPKVRALDPYRSEILLRYRDGQTLQNLVDWLAAPPREIIVSRQSVHGWIKTQLRRLERLSSEFKNVDLSLLERPSIAGPASLGHRSESVHPAPATAPSSDPAVSVAADGMPRINVRPSSAAFVPPTEGPAPSEPEVTSGNRGDRHKPKPLF